ncbi:ESX-1 secretion-associated protein [Mycolicibacterium neoaurum]|uniref:ESX-1 secretion-associated protein n=1 Tax=Mycolicibacterium neoaurum TaxID=1795 RepID=UPI002671A161|nr:ESX-1 secretion-associated protein [Mycolicibacterium neoaurum]MDO3403413.1 ESX-1 secretion-associated protein [Mycolicibacterium neoaurum]
MATDSEQNLRVLTEHIDQIAASQGTAAGVLKVAGETVNDIGNRVSDTHGVACFASNSAIADVERARDEARKKLWHMSYDLSQRLTMASQNYNNADWRASKDIGACEF